MSDNKKKIGAPDRNRVAGGEAYEVDYVARKLQKEFPDASRKAIEKAITDSAKIPQFHNNRVMVENSARLKLKNQ
jgi:Protein of unknown function (DUF3606).